MEDIRKQHTGRFMSQVAVAVAAIRGDQTMSELSSEYGVHASAINRWEKQALEALPEVLGKKNSSWDKEKVNHISN